MKEYPKALYRTKSDHVIVNDEIEELERQEQGYGSFADAPDDVAVDTAPDAELTQLKQELVELNADNEALRQRNELLTKENEQLKAQVGMFQRVEKAEDIQDAPTTAPIIPSETDPSRADIIAQLTAQGIEFNPKAGTAVLAAKLAKAQE